ncbi:hypothetical protein AC622_01870 [Bacillus sp. FJAT-27916]|uniref:hypothetical protein n=1 Tax=Bacillus sp. FJAT-27916 TaxID=1679169 RepID=UPI000671325E|nr:hypothetical protein [Bacillus sp. FJAT-27916]KMY43156.1 hypothetical protein AC622_01870 [Bacillus sp. FJAT-27916]
MDIKIKVNKFEEVFLTVLKMVKDIEKEASGIEELKQSSRLVKRRAEVIGQRFHYLQLTRAELPEFYERAKENLDIDTNQLLLDCLRVLADIEVIKGGI